MAKILVSLIIILSNFLVACGLFFMSAMGIGYKYARLGNPKILHFWMAFVIINSLVIAILAVISGIKLYDFSVRKGVNIILSTIAAAIVFSVAGVIANIVVIYAALFLIDACLG